MRTVTITVRVVPCRDCNGGRGVDAHQRSQGRGNIFCETCGGRGEVAATSDRLLVGLRLAWDSFR